MTDGPILLDGKPVPEKPKAEGIQVDANGDPILQGTKMQERDSLDRVIEGLKIASDAAAHLVKSEPGNTVQWRGLAKKLDQARRICVQYAGVGLVLKEKETQEVRGEPMNWRWARDRFRYGIEQASGGCKQMATCHRGDLWWSRMGNELEMIEIKLRPKSPQQLAARNIPKLIMPGTMH